MQQCNICTSQQGSYKYVHILVSLRNTSFKILVARIPNPVAQKKTDALHIHFFFLRHWCQLTRCAAPTEMHCPMPWLLKRSYAMLLVFILAFFDFAFLFLVSLSPVFVRFPPDLKPNLQTHFKGSSTRTGVIDNSWKTNECSSRQSDRKASGCCTLVIRRKLWRPCRMVSRWFHDMLMVSWYYAACFERPLNLFEHNTISGLGQCRDGSNINTSSQCQCLSQDLHFFPKKELFNFFRELFAKESCYPSTTKLLDEARK